MQADIARPLARTNRGRAQARSIRILSTVALAALVAGCQGFPGADATRTDAGGGLPSAQLIERDIEAPEIFQADDLALWDGRPSLGGVWVAATDVRQPERVIMRNPATGKQVVGALFKKEHPDDGIGLMLSSDAAVALGVAAGQPTDITVVALREREEPAGPVAASQPFDVEGTTTADGYLEESTSEAADDFTETAAASSVATTTLGEDTADDLAAGPLPDPSPVTAAATTVASVATDSLTDAAPAGQTLLDRVGAAVEAANAAEAARETTGSDQSAEADGATTEAPLTLEALESALAAPATPTASVETASLDTAVTDTPAPLPDALAPVPSLTDQITAAVAATEAAEAAAREEGRYVPVGLQPATAPGVTTSSLDAGGGLGPATGASASRAYVQIGSYSTEAAAKAAAEEFAATGITTEVKASGRVWRVLLGPIQTVDQQSAALRKAQDLGFDDAYPVGG